MAEPPCIPAWSATQAGLVLDGALTISFQRFLLEGRTRLDAPPASLGALEPGMDGSGAFLIPLHPGEALWIGAAGSDAWPAARAIAWLGGRSHDLADGRPAPLAEATPISCRPVAVLAGLPQPDGDFLPFAVRQDEATIGCARLEFEPFAADGQPAASVARIELVTPRDFTARTGREAPLPANSEHGYRGWRLP